MGFQITSSYFSKINQKEMNVKKQRLFFSFLISFLASGFLGENETQMKIGTHQT